MLRAVVGALAPCFNHDQYCDSVLSKMDMQRWIQLLWKISLNSSVFVCLACRDTSSGTLAPSSPMPSLAPPFPVLSSGECPANRLFSKVASCVENFLLTCFLVAPPVGIWCMAWWNWCRWSDSWATSSTTPTACSLAPSSQPRILVGLCFSPCWRTSLPAGGKIRSWCCVGFLLCSHGVGHLQRAACGRWPVRAAVWRERVEWRSGHCPIVVSSHHLSCCCWLLSFVVFSFFFYWVQGPIWRQI